MPVVGQADTAALFVLGGDVTTVAALAVVSPTLTSVAAVGEATADVGLNWTCPVPAYTVPGIWRHVWTVTGAGAGTFVTLVDVAPSGMLTALPWAYATTTHLAEYLNATTGFPQALPEGAEGKLHRASQRIDELLKSAVYPVDSNELPTDAKHIVALREATCELVAWWIDTGDESGAQAAFTGSVTAGRISLSRGAQATGAAKTRGGWWVSSHVLTVLWGARLLGHAPYTL